GVALGPGDLLGPHPALRALDRTFRDTYSGCVEGFGDDASTMAMMATLSAGFRRGQAATTRSSAPSPAWWRPRAGRVCFTAWRKACARTARGHAAHLAFDFGKRTRSGDALRAGKSFAIRRLFTRPA